jgi:hypothetical protein
MNKRGRRPRQTIAVIPAKEFLDKVVLTHAFVPERIYLDEAALVTQVFDSVFNDHCRPTDEIVKTCFNMTSYADEGDIAFVHDLVDNNMAYLSELLQVAKEKAERIIPCYNYAGLYRISWDTRSIYMKVL